MGKNGWYLWWHHYVNGYIYWSSRVQLIIAIDENPPRQWISKMYMIHRFTREPFSIHRNSSITSLYQPNKSSKKCSTITFHQTMMCLFSIRISFVCNPNLKSSLVPKTMCCLNIIQNQHPVLKHTHTTTCCFRAEILWK